MRGGARGAAAVMVFVGLVVLGAALTPAVQAQTSSQLNSQIEQAYSAVLSAEKSGGNVTGLVAELNSALALVQQADQVNASNPAKAQALYARAANITSTVQQDAPSVAATGRASVATARIELAVETVVLGALAVFAYFYTPRLFWRAWVRLHRGWRVRKA